MGKRKNKADQETYRRIYTERALRPPKGRRWTKPAAIIKALETMLVKDTKADAVTIAGLTALRDFADSFRNRVVVRRRDGALGKGKLSHSGNVFLEYAWDNFVKRGVILTENDIMAAVHSGAIERWHKALCGGRSGTVKQERVMCATNPERLRQQIKAAQSAKPKVDPAKTIGDQIRAEAEAARQRRAEFAAQWKAEEALKAQLRAKLKGA